MIYSVFAAAAVVGDRSELGTVTTVFHYFFMYSNILSIFIYGTLY